MRLALLSLWACLACSGAPTRSDVNAGCSIAVGALELCGPDCRPALDITRAACTVLAGGRVDVCQVALDLREGEGQAHLPPGPPGAASQPSAAPGAPLAPPGAGPAPAGPIEAPGPSSSPSER